MKTLDVFGRGAAILKQEEACFYICEDTFAFQGLGLPKS